MKSRTQKLNSTAFAFALRLFLKGVESAVILPSVWQYLQMFHADYWYLGLVLSAYSAVAVASAIVVGRLADGSVVNIMLLGIVLNLFEVVIQLMIIACLSLVHTCHKNREFLRLTHVNDYEQAKVWEKYQIAFAKVYNSLSHISQKKPSLFLMTIVNWALRRNLDLKFFVRRINTKYND